ncbi:MAG: hydrogenase expression/formation protein HypE [Bacillota bacterium]
MTAREKGQVLLAHGDGGLLTHQLIADLFLPLLGNPVLRRLEDAAVLELGGGRVAFTTDSFVVRPLFFPGGDIGRLAVCGTVNDLAMVGARPLYLSAGFLLEEGLDLGVLERVVDSMRRAASEAGVQVVAADTKVVERGSVDGIFINTAGLGLVPPGTVIGPEAVRPGDRLLLNGPVGEHELAVVLARENLGVESSVSSDCAALNHLVADIMTCCPGALHFLRDPTRGGLATVAREMAAACGLDFYLEEDCIPLTDEARALCDLLGLDPLYLANEGKFLAVVDAAQASRVLEACRAHPLGAGASLVGEVRPGRGYAYLITSLGGTRRLELSAGAQFPRIC